ncbi:hypothetical protein K466DRAFT_250774 [Polyporus arcularius HHB13444]|uniref:Uncharacterized protein n=1 Tax=Polyporus arcularius HHB13444 TaxID=1314778 RepID=A0A5C3P251_9APHY|nr:hypothetical protein K466DRAFT_250774 [Polyporus arcularius HHB13444]
MLRRRPRAPPPGPEPIQTTGPRFCDATILADDKYNPMCTVRLPHTGPRFCARHSREFAESRETYKGASLHMEALQPRVFAFSRKNKAGKFHDPKDVREAITTTEEFIEWAKKELDGRRTHTARFYAYAQAHDERREAHTDRRVGLGRPQLSRVRAHNGSSFARTTGTGTPGDGGERAAVLGTIAGAALLELPHDSRRLSRCVRSGSCGRRGRHRRSGRGRPR